MSASELPEEAYAAALASIRGIGPRTLRKLLFEVPDTSWSFADLDLHPASSHGVWETILSGHRLDEDGRWRQEARCIDVERLWSGHVQQGISVRIIGSSNYPQILTNDPEAPVVLFAIGNLDVIDSFPTVALVGTRSPTRYGLGVAAGLGAELATSGIAVVSGLAIGIDGAAHEGACAGFARAGKENGTRDFNPGPPIAVVAGGLDTPYPSSHSRLFERVSNAGVIVSESPVGLRAERWRFPMRNRILAAISDVIVVVESHHGGGSIHTVRAGLERGIPIGAVPGSIRSPASKGTNDLLADGCFPVRDVSDIAVALALANAGSETKVQRSGSTRLNAKIHHALPAEKPGLSTKDAKYNNLSAIEKTVFESVDWEPNSLDGIVSLSNLPLSTVCVCLERLSEYGLVNGENGWWERR